MRIAISNIAWDPVEDELVSQLLNHYQVDAIDIAPGKYFPDPLDADESEIDSVRRWWHMRGIEITGMQALLFGANGLNMFGSDDVQEAMLGHLAAVTRIGAGLGASRLVFGSPGNRDRSGLTDAQTMSIAVNFFRRLGDIAQRDGVIFCLEPNPPRYGANFMINSTETAQVVEQIGHPAIKMQLDTGALAINDENIEQIMDRYSSIIGHIHASEPGLIPLGDHTTVHSVIYEALSNYLPKHVVSIEMLATKHESHLVSIERALLAAIMSYRPKDGVVR